MIKLSEKESMLLQAARERIEDAKAELEDAELDYRRLVNRLIDSRGASDAGRDRFMRSFADGSYGYKDAGKF